eukprot:gene417-6832_t
MNVDKFPVPGGFSQPKDKTDEVQSIAEQMQSQVEEAIGQKYRKYEVTRFHTQVVAGLNYLIYINVDEDALIELKVYKDLQQVCHFKHAKLCQ